MGDIIKQQAVAFSNMHHLGYVAAVHLEDEEDRRFWDPILQSVRPGRYYYIYYSKSRRGINTTGCTQCLQYRPYLSKKFFICIDSDLKRLTDVPDVDPEHFIAQTHTYSWENHYCFADNLQRILEDKCPKAASRFDFRLFLREYSEAVYKPLLFLVHLKINDIEGFSEKDFRFCLPSQCCDNDLKDNGMSLIEETAVRLREECCSHPEWKKFDYKYYSDKLERCGLRRDNAYLFVRGHNIWNIVNAIGYSLCRNYSTDFKNDVLWANLDFDNSSSLLDNVHSDLSKIVG